VRQGNGNPLNRVPSFTLGTDEVTPLAMAGAYGTFANHGTRCQSIAISRVTDRDGKDLAVPRADCQRVLDRKVADSVTSILSQVIDGPLGGRTGRLMSLGRDAAGKTGTTNSSASVWFVGFTPDLAAAVATYDPRGANGFPMKNITIGGVPYAQVFGSTLPGPIWKDAMEAALKDVPPSKFELTTIDGLGVYVPPPPKSERPKPGRNDPGEGDGGDPATGPTTPANPMPPANPSTPPNP
jgi:membrane peptidoglycan carboxypeptidase